MTTPTGISLGGRAVLVTGGSRGLGAAITLAMARAGADVVACYVHEGDHLDHLRRELDTTPGKHELVRADVTVPADVDALVARLRDRFGVLDTVVNNAGVISHVPFAELPADEWHRVLDTNLTSVYTVVQAALPLLRPGSSVINVGSGSATVGLALRAHYTATKAGLIGLSRSLARELGPDGVRVNLLQPGVVQTEKELADDVVTRYEAKTSLGRLGRPEEIGDVAVFLASDLASYVTGATLDVNGGI